MIELSILILTIPNRLTQCRKLVDYLQSLIQDIQKTNQIEIIVFYDNKFHTVAQKRQKLLDQAQGKYLVFIDDDDWVTTDYFKELWPIISKQESVDMILYDMKTQWGITHFDLHAHYSSKYIKNNTTGPRHIHVIKSEIANQQKFNPLLRFNEDLSWIKLVRQNIQSTQYIKKVLYIYKDNYQTSETRKYRAKPLRVISKLPVPTKTIILDNFWDLSTHPTNIPNGVAVAGIWNSLHDNNNSSK